MGIAQPVVHRQPFINSVRQVGVRKGGVAVGAIKERDAQLNGASVHLLVWRKLP